MNNCVKVTLLAIAIVFAMGGVLWFYKTKVSPPQKLDLIDQYVSDIKEDISKIKNLVRTDYNLDWIYTTVTHKIEFQRDNKLLSNEERDRQLKNFIEEYVPVFVDNCSQTFRQRNWDRRDTPERIRTRIDELSALTTSNGDKLLERDCKASLGEVQGVINDYYGAWGAAKVRGYSGLESAKQKISAADRYGSMEYIKNCIYLAEQLKNVRSGLEQAHYSYLRQRVKRLSDSTLSKNDYDNLVRGIKNEMNEYEHNARTVYGRATDLDPLRRDANKYQEEYEKFHKDC